MSEKEEKIEEIEEFEMDNKTQEYVHALEHEFDKYRIYGDERDIKLFKIKESKFTGFPCMIQRVSAWFDPRNMMDFNNQMILSHKYVEDLIDRFKEYRKTHKIPLDIKKRLKPEIDDIDKILKKNKKELEKAEKKLEKAEKELEKEEEEDTELW
ncbi:hypothetical protein LCGC14_2218640 [marine sediment metagenome]|uniref:Uncharacterized protein n=1 Tax=marine sediment metagenome TaxID=412755 RepID=A0A0F9DBM2_9ZZZZ